MSFWGAPGSLPPPSDTSVRVSQFASLLTCHLDPQLVSYVLRGLSEGFSIGVEGRVGPGSTRNNWSALDNVVGVDDTIRWEVSKGFLAARFLTSLSQIYIVRLLVPSGSQVVRSVSYWICLSLQVMPLTILSTRSVFLQILLFW